ncbi:hypothetical protein J6590_016499 [Homalodisca vitripennis]|nr:hypothetical protein J6590_016499 [Homalodisca vitripennis]
MASDSKSRVCDVRFQTLENNDSQGVLQEAEERRQQAAQLHKHWTSLSILASRTWVTATVAGVIQGDNPPAGV